MKITKQRIKEIIREELLREALFKKLIIPNDTKTKKLVSNMIKQMKLKIDKDYDMGYGDRNTFLLDIDVKHLDKVITYLMQNRVRVR